jgi:hypothetical protein
VAVAV